MKTPHQPSPSWLIFAAVTLFLTSLSASGSEYGTYKTSEEFLSEQFDGQPPAPAVLWLSGALRKQVDAILGHAYHQLRIRHWTQGDRSAFVLEEIGKEEPITVGVSTQDGHIHALNVLVFRESRGWEVKFPFFTDQFREARLTPNHALNNPIDGITGATLSVTAVTKLAKMALVLDQHIRRQALNKLATTMPSQK